MPRSIVSVAITRDAKTRTATAGYTIVPGAIAGSPFLCRVFRKPQTTVDRDEAAPATATIDQMIVLSILDTTAAVKINDLATLPDGSKGKIIRIRRYARTLQCDLETGVE